MSTENIIRKCSLQIAYIFVSRAHFSGQRETVMQEEQYTQKNSGHRGTELTEEQ